MARGVVVLPAPLPPRSATMLPSSHLQRDALEHQDHVVVDDLDAVDVENNLFRVHGVAFAVPIEKIAMQPFRLAAAQEEQPLITGP